MTESLAIGKWAKGLMTASTALVAIAGGNIWSGYAPDGSHMPCVVFEATGGSDTLTSTGNRHSSTHRLTVKAISIEGYGAAGAIESIFDGLFVSGTTVDGVTIIYVARTGDLAYEQVDGNNVYYQVGATYEVTVQRRA